MVVSSPKKMRRNLDFERVGVYIIMGVVVIAWLFTLTGDSRTRNKKQEQEKNASSQEDFSKFDWNITPMSSFIPSKSVGCDHNAQRDVVVRTENTKSVQEALSYRAQLQGFHKKLGMTDPVNWMRDYREERNLKTSLWFALPHSKKKECLYTQPPYQYPGCLVHINHHYKFIWIKGKKVGGTAIREPLGWICKDYWKVPDVANTTLCSETWYQDSEITVKEAEKYWSEYFVFAFVRNPYSRFASSYTYIDGLMGGCSKSLASFDKVCYFPFLQAKVCSLMTCCWSGAVSHHIHHIMEQSSCLFTKSGEIAVDFVGEMESLDEDLQTILEVINTNKDSHLPALTVPGSELKKANSHKHSPDDYAVSLYEENEVCLGLVEDNYYLDFRRLGYPRITESML